MIFTASQIARAIHKKRQTVQRLLATVEPSGQVILNGNPAKGYELPALPKAIRDELKSSAARGHYRDEEHLLQVPCRRWEPPVPVSEIAQLSLEKAAKLQRALRRVLALQNDLAVPAQDLERAGLDDYTSEFGHPITGRYLRALVKRTLERDAGAGELGRLELYLDERPARKRAPKRTIPADTQNQFHELLGVIATFKDRAAPREAEKAYLWLRTFELYEETIESGRKPKKARGALLKFLWNNAPFLAKNPNALRVSFQHKYRRWLEGDRAANVLADARKGSGFHRAPELKAEDRNALIAHAVLNCDGRVSQAWRELRQSGALSEELLGYYLSNPTSKSHCPTRIREAVKYEIGMMEDIHHGPRQDKLNGAHLSRDWNGVASMDWFCADDATLEVYFYLQDDKGLFTLMRGQFLVFQDVRSMRVLGFALQPERNYNARVIRTLITRICDEHGLPRKGFYFERGIWQSSRILKGDPNADPFSWGETELGLRSLGLRFVHSRLPRSKPIERVIGAIQDLCEGEPGYVGPDEMHERFERVQKAKLQVEARKVHPSEHFYSLDEWVARLDEICQRYNAAPQDGKMTCGLSPDEAFRQFAHADDPPIKLPAGCRYLLAHHKRPVKVTNNGITLRFGNQAFNYRNEQTGRLRGQTVLAWFNPDLPEILTVTDMNRENAFCIERSQDVPAMDAPAELLGQEMARIEAHQSHARVRYRMLRAKFATPFRRPIVDGPTAELGRQMEAERGRITTERRQQEAQLSKARKAFNRLGMTTRTGQTVRPGQAEAAERLSQFLNEEESA